MNKTTPRADNHRTGSRGFTLIELLVTLAIIGILSGMLVPRLPDLGASRLKSTARRLAGTISYLYDRAAASKLVYRLTLDLDKKKYYVSLLNTQNRFEKTELTFAKETALPDKIEFTEARTASQGVVIRGTAVIHFYPSGFSDLSVIHLKDNNKNELTLMVHPLTGRVKIFEGYRDIATISLLKKSFPGFFSWKSEKRGFRFSSFSNHFSFLKNGGTSMYRYIRPLKTVIKRPANKASLFGGSDERSSVVLAGA